MGPASPVTAAPTAPPPTQDTTDNTVEQAMEQVDFLQAIAKMRAGMGIETPELEKIVIGRGGRPGIRSVLQDYINANADKFNVEDPAGAAAFELLEESVKLAEGSLSASHEEAKKIYAKLRFIRELAKKTQGEQSGIANQLDSVIAPIEEQLKKRTSFGEFIKEKVQDFKKTLPERLVSKIPVVGGLLGQFMREKRESKEELERFSGEIQESISRKGRRGADLSLPGAKRNQPRVEGGTRASDIPGFIEPPSSSADSIGRDSTTIGAIYKEVAAIRKLLVEEFKPSGEELRARESELEGITPTAAARPATERRGGVLGGLFGSLMKSLGLGGGEGGGIGGTISDVLSMLPGKKLLGRAGGMIGRGLGAAGRFAGRMGGRALGLLKTTSLFKDASAIGKTVSSVGKGAFEMAKSAGTRALNAGKSVGGKALDIGKSVGGKALDIGKSVGGKALDIGKSVGGKALDIGKSVGGKAAGWLSNAFGSVSGAVSNLNPAKALGSAVKSGAGKLAKGIISIPGLGAIITTAMGFLDIKSIKNDPELSPDEKKERIGRTLVGTLGQALGSVGGGALGSLALPGIGTLLGTFGGMWVGEKLAGLLADAIGGRGIYDMVASIPGVGSLIEVGGAEDQKDKAQTEAQVSKTAASAGAEGQTIGTEATGTISAPATPNTTVGKMVQQHNAEMSALEAERGAAVGTATKPSVNNNAVVQTKVSNTTNNFNDDLRIRNNEPTLKTMQMASHTW
jgi:hypothetical protein